MKKRIRIHTSKGATFFVIAFYVIVTIILALLYHQEFGWGEILLFDVLVISVFIIMFIGVGAFIIYMNRYAILSEDGVIFRSIITVVGAFKWSEVVKAEISERLSAPDKEGKKRMMREIRIETDAVVNENYKMDSPYIIFFTPQNQRILLTYLEKYTSGLDLTSFQKTYAADKQIKK